MAIMGVVFSLPFVCLFFRTISQKLMQLGSPNLICTCSTMSPGNPFILESKGQDHEAQYVCVGRQTERSIATSCIYKPHWVFPSVMPHCSSSKHQIWIFHVSLSAAAAAATRHWPQIRQRDRQFFHAWIYLTVTGQKDQWSQWQKHCRHGSLLSCECWLFLVLRVKWCIMLRCVISVVTVAGICNSVGGVFFWHATAVAVPVANIGRCQG